MNTPNVVAVCLTADRQEMTDRAVRAFARQTYPNRYLLISDNGDRPYRYPSDLSADESARIYGRRDPSDCGKTIGELRNRANLAAYRGGAADIIMHWDSDDWSAPTRMADQVEHLQRSGAQAVGYNEMLFWETLLWEPVGQGLDPLSTQFSDNLSRVRYSRAWLYTNRNPRYCLGTSLCYWVIVWHSKQFAPTSAGEDAGWCEGLKTEGVSALERADFASDSFAAGCPPEMIAEVHGGNTHHKRIQSQERDPEPLRVWRRVPEWDSRVREIMIL